MMGKMKVKTKKKTTKRPELSRGVFYAMAFLCLASTITACSIIFGGGWFNDSKDNVSVRNTSTHPADNNNSVIVSPVVSEKVETPITWAVELENLVDEKIEIAIVDHEKDKHHIDAHYTLMKCHQLGSNTFSCKIVQGKNIPLPDKKDVPIVEKTKDEDESKVEKENKTKNWNPFE